MLVGRNHNIDSLSKENFKASALRSLRNTERDRKWKTHLKTHAGADGLMYSLPPEYMLKNHIDLHRNPQQVGLVTSMLTGHCHLGLHKYKLSLTYTPTCACLEEDESVQHRIFKCKIYESLRRKIGLTDHSIDINKIELFCQGLQ